MARKSWLCELATPRVGHKPLHRLTYAKSKNGIGHWICANGCGHKIWNGEPSALIACFNYGPLTCDKIFTPTAENLTVSGGGRYRTEVICITCIDKMKSGIPGVVNKVTFTLELPKQEIAGIKEDDSEVDPFLKDLVADVLADRKKKKEDE